MKRVTIVGMADRELPAGELWGLTFDPDFPHFDRGFEMHRPINWEKKPPGYLRRLETSHCPIYMHEPMSEVPVSVRYPIEVAVAFLGMDWFESSIGYAFTLAMMEGYEQIALHGVEMAANFEYAYQRPNMAYLVGLARGRGIEVFGAETLLRHSDYHPQWPERYGLEE